MTNDILDLINAKTKEEIEEIIRRPIFRTTSEEVAKNSQCVFVKENEGYYTSILGILNGVLTATINKPLVAYIDADTNEITGWSLLEEEE